MAVAVWTRQNDYNVSIPYPPDVSNGIEQVFLANQGVDLSQIGRIQLGPFNSEFAGVSVDLGIWKQCLCDSGRRFTVQRSILESTSAAAKGYVWEYEGDTPSEWVTYDVNTMRYLEKAFAKIEKRRPKSKKKQPVINLKRHLGMPYVIDVETFQQTRVDTGKVRDIQRRPLNQPYLPDTPIRILSSSSSDSDTDQNNIVTRLRLKKRRRAAGQGTSQQANGTPSTSTPSSSQQPPAASATVQQPASATGGSGSASGAAAKPKSVGRKKQQSRSSPSKTAAAASKEREPLPTENKIRIDSKKSKGARSPEDLIEKYTTLLNIFEEDVKSEEDEDVDGASGEDKSEECYICFEKLSDPSSFGPETAEACVVVQLKHCKHKLHRLCLVEMCKAAKKSDGLQCPFCKYIYGEKTGNCPSGVMTWDIRKGQSVEGYKGYDTISVSYDIRPGVQGPEHPSPGQPFYTQGFPRVGYLPDTDQGRKVLKLMIEAWRRRLMFTVGTSYTTGSSDVVTWNEVHHKTELHGNCYGHGYPDPAYLDNVVLELADHGVTEDCL